MLFTEQLLLLLEVNPQFSVNETETLDALNLFKKKKFAYVQEKGLFWPERPKKSWQRPNPLAGARR